MKLPFICYNNFFTTHSAQVFNRSEEIFSKQEFYDYAKNVSAPFL